MRLRVGIVFGGRSTEHEVSLRSAYNILQAIDKKKYEPILIWVSKGGEWSIVDASLFVSFYPDLSLAIHPGKQCSIAFVPGRGTEMLFKFGAKSGVEGIDVVFPIIHGAFGEDGGLQGMLKAANVPFVGADVLASAICMDKDVTKRLLREAQLPVVPFVSVHKSEANLISFLEVSHKLGAEMFIKPATQGSSVGVSRVACEKSFLLGLSEAFEFDNKILIESAIDGREFECSILGNCDPVASVCGEVVVSEGFYSYDKKYNEHDDVRLDFPANLDQATTRLLQETALKSYRVLECSGLARVDFFMDECKNIYINEVNTLPGFTDVSMFPKLWEASGISLTSLIERLIVLSIDRFAEKETYNSPE